MEIPGLVSADEVEVPGAATPSGVRVVVSGLISSTAWAASGREGKRKATRRRAVLAPRVPVMRRLRLGVAMRRRG